MDLKREHQKWARRVGWSLATVEHFRVPNYRPAMLGTHWRGADNTGQKDPDNRIRHGYEHIGVVVLNTGWCFVARSRPNWRDNYNRKRGHTIAVGRALKRAALVDQKPDFAIDRKLIGTNNNNPMRDEIRKYLGLPIFQKENSGEKNSSGSTAR